MVEPPRGPLITLVFTDIQGSTPLWDAVPEAMRAGLALHDAVLRTQLEAHGGYEFRTEGDAFKVAFESPVAAVRWCIAVQHALLDQPWPDALCAQPDAADAEGCRGLRVRMGAHLGTIEVVTHPVTGRADFFGPAVNETARIAALPAGGQVVVSQRLWDVADLKDVASKPLGAHLLRGVSEPVDIVEIDLGLGRAYPALRASLATRTNLDSDDDAFVGRDDDLNSVHAAFAKTRCITLLGPGGTGKTRLSREYARRRLHEYPGGTWFCDLSESTAMDEVPGVLGAALQVPGANADTLGPALCRLGEALLVLDNLEQLPGHPLARLLDRWLKAAPKLHLLLTSRHAVGLKGEHRIELAPLVTDDAVTLLSERIEQVRGRPVEPGERDAARALVQALDCMPLAIELAAARSDMMDLDTLRKRLRQRFRLLASRTEAPARQATLRGAIDWSWELLTPEERQAAAQCAVFAGGFDIAAAEAVLSLDDPDAWVMDVVQSLRQKSILRARTDEVGRTRLGMYVALREYALEHLGEAPDLRRRHANWAAQSAWNSVLDRGRSASVVRLLDELPNLVTALEHTDDPICRGRLALGVAMGAQLLGRDDHTADEAVEAARASGDAQLLCRALDTRARSHRLFARGPEALVDTDEGIALARTHGLDRVLGELLVAKALLFFYGQVDAAVRDALLEEARSACERADNPVYSAVVVAHDAYFSHDLDGIEAAITRARKAGADVIAAWIGGFGHLMYIESGRTEDAVAVAMEQVSAYQRGGSRSELAGSLLSLALMRALIGNRDGMAQAFVDAKSVAAPLDGAALAATLRFAEPACFALMDGDPEAAAPHIAGLEAPGEDGRSWAQRSVTAWMTHNVLVRLRDAPQ